MSKVRLTPVDVVKALQICRVVEKLLAPHGFHCALGGSCMYKGHSEKDVDIIVYPHQTEIPSRGVLLRVLIESGFKHIVTTNAPYTKRPVWITEYQGIRVEFFNLTDIIYA